eukprot:6021241-Pyramimonas_sp.AAC.2
MQAYERGGKDTRVEAGALGLSLRASSHQVSNPNLCFTATQTSMTQARLTSRGIQASTRKLTGSAMRGLKRATGTGHPETLHARLARPD